MSILETTESVREEAKKYGNYRHVATVSGVGYQWLSKFAVGSIPNPTVNNVAKLEAFFKKKTAENASNQVCG